MVNEKIVNPIDKGKPSSENIIEQIFQSTYYQQIKNNVIQVVKEYDHTGQGYVHERLKFHISFDENVATIEYSPYYDFLKVSVMDYYYTDKVDLKSYKDMINAYLLTIKMLMRTK